MIRILILVSLVLGCSTVLADAEDGDFLGFKLGERYLVPRGATGDEHITGALTYIVDPGSHPHHIDSMSIYVSPQSFVIGSIFGEWYFSSERRARVFADRYMASLQARYPHWRPGYRGATLTHSDYELWVEVERKPPIVVHWPSDLPVRVGIGLVYAPETMGRGRWMALVRSELGEDRFVAR